MAVLKYWDGSAWIHVGAGMAWSPGDLKMTLLTTASEGWLICDGSLVAQATYPNLFAAIGHSANNGNDPGGGNFKLPDLRQRFPMGKAASGTGSTIGDVGGSNDAIAVAHNHTQDSHTHGQAAHDHTSAAHGHTISDPGHEHAADGDFGNRYAVSIGASSHNLRDGGTITQAVTFTDIDSNTTGLSVNGTAVGVNNNTAVNSSSTATNQSAGASGSGANMPAFQVVNFLIKT